MRLRRTQPSWQQLRQLHRVLGPIERGLVVFGILLIVGATALFSAKHLIASVVHEPAPGGTYREALVGQPQFINPLFANASVVDADLARLLFAGLLRYDTELAAVPDVAETVTLSEDQTTYTITLREDRTWHDGTPVTVDDAIFTFEHITNPDLGSPLAASFTGVVVERVDERTIRFTLPQPYAPFVDALTTGLIPKHIWESIPLQEWRFSDFNLRPVGNGSWQFATLNKNRQGVTTEYRVRRTNTEKGYLETLLFQFYETEDAAKDALVNGRVHGLALVAPTLTGGGRFTEQRIATHELSFPSTTAIFFNPTNDGPLTDVNVRRALNLAIDKRTLVLETLGGQATVTRGPFPVSMSPNPSEKDPPLTGDPVAAGELLTNAGWKSSPGQKIRTNDNEERLTVTLSVVDRQPDRTVAEYVQAAWQRIGVAATIDLISPPTPDEVTQRVLRPRSYEALLYTIVYGARLDPYPFWHSSQRVDPGLNFGFLENEDVDDAIETIRQEHDAEIYTEELATIHRIAIDTAVASFLYAPVRYYLVTNDVGGVSVNSIAVPADRFATIDDWYIEKTWHFR